MCVCDFISGGTVDVEQKYNKDSILNGLYVTNSSGCSLCVQVSSVQRSVLKHYKRPGQVV